MQQPTVVALLVDGMIVQFSEEWLRSPEGRVELRTWMQRNEKFRGFQSRRFNETVRSALAEASGRKL